jgi:hypothetical protein
MNHSQLNQLWQLLEAMLPTDTELCVHAVGIRSEGSGVCVGRDKQARRHLLIPLPKGKPSAPPFKSAGLFIRTRPLLRDGSQRPFLDLVCLSTALNDVFSHLILDVLQGMRPDEPEAAEICRRVLEEWKELFGSGSGGMGKEQITGLVGELLILDKLTAFSPSALSCWDGPAGGIHDFRQGCRALEVKTSTRRHGRFFTISGHQQIEAPIGGDLHFAALKLEQNPGGALSIPMLLERIRRNGVDPTLLLEQLNELGYAPGASEQADSVRFDASECRYYPVNDQFPRVIAASFVGGQPPAGVIKISYEIDLSTDSPAPLTSAAANSFLQAFAIGGSA